MQSALTLLDEELGRSELISAVAPLRLISVGGFLAVKFFHNRETTTDIDVLIDPNVDADRDYRATVLEAINAVSKAHGFAEDWLNDQLRIFIKDDLRMLLFLESIQQNVLLYAGENLQIYAGHLDFALERKLRRIAQRQGNRNIDDDTSDALAIVHHMVSSNGHPLSREECVGLDENGFGLLIDEAAVDLVAERYLDKYGVQGIVRIGWDAATQKWRYRSLEGEWIYI